MAKKIDLLRIIALLMLISSIFYFYLILFAPKSIPYYLRLSPLPKNMNVLVMGLDVAFAKEKHAPISGLGHTDTMILVSLNTSNFKASILSIPRDTLVEIPGYGWQKVNSAFYLGGAQLAMETVSKFLGVPVNHFVVINPKGLIKLIDLMGGIDIYVDKDMNYEDKWGGLKIDLKKGQQKLNGEQAHGYVRFRQDAFGDVSRVQRQQEFLQTVLRKMATPRMLVKAPWVLSIAFDSIKTDLSLKDILYSLNFSRGLRREDIYMTILPGKFSVGRSRSSIWSPDNEELREIMNRHFSKKLLAKFEPGNIPSNAVTIIDNSGDFDAVRQMMKILYKKDYAILNVLNQKKPGVTRTQILAQKGDAVGAKKLGGLLGIKEVYASSTGDMQSDFTIVLCADWRQAIEDKLSR